MKRAYVANNIPEAHAVKSILEDHGIPAAVQGENLQMLRGSASLANEYPEVHVGDDANMERVKELLNRERQAGFESIDIYKHFEAKVKETKNQLVNFLKEAGEDGKTVIGYGAPGKGNTLLNYCGIGPELLSYTVDRNPYKQGKYLPGSHIPVFSPAKIRDTKPDYVVILPWNLKDDILGLKNHQIIIAF